MADKSLKDRAIDIKGKQYVYVSDRIIYFNETYPNGVIQTELLSALDSNRIVIKAKVVPDIDKPDRVFVDYAQEMIGDGFINKTSALENASTSAIGRALALMGIGVIDSVASVDEITKAKNNSKEPSLNRPTDEQKRSIMSLASELNWSMTPDDMKEFNDLCNEVIGIPQPLNRDQADKVIVEMTLLVEQQRLGV